MRVLGFHEEKNLGSGCFTTAANAPMSKFKLLLLSMNNEFFSASSFRLCRLPPFWHYFQDLRRCFELSLSSISCCQLEDLVNYKPWSTSHDFQM